MNRYLIDHFTDPVFGGLSSAIDHDAARVLTTDQQLDTAALATMLAIPGSSGSLRLFLERFADPAGGYYEFIERTGRPHELAATKTADRQYLSAIALLSSADSESAAAGMEQLRFADATFYHKDHLVEAVASTDAQVLDDRSKTDSVALRLWAHSLSPDFDNAANQALADVFALIKDNGELPDWTQASGQPVCNAQLRLRSSALTGLALAAAVEHGLAKEPELTVQVIERLLAYVAEGLWDSRFSGHWEHGGLDGTIMIHREFITLLNTAIPIKTTETNAWYALAVQALINHLPAQRRARAQSWLDRTCTYLATLIDHHGGGVFTGEGFFWTPPGTPVGPFIREVLPPRNTPGVFSFGATPYRRLYNKEARTQVLVALVLRDLTAQAEPIINLHPIRTLAKRKVAQLTRTDISVPLQDELAHVIATQAHAATIDAAFMPGLGYGWTPRTCPLGSVPNTAPSVFAIHHSIANLLVIGRHPRDPKSLIRWIRASRAATGAYADYPGGPSDVLNTYLAVNSLELLGYTFTSDEMAPTINYLRSAQNLDGGFGVVQGFPSDLFHTNLATVALNSLSGTPADQDSVIDYILSARNDDGGYGERVGTPSDTYSVYRAIGTLATLGYDLAASGQTTDFLESCYTESGGYSNEPVGPASLIATYHGVASRFLLGSASHQEQTRSWLSQCQTPEGTFSNVPGVRAGTIDEGFAAVQSLGKR